MSLLGRLFGGSNDNDMAESEAIEWGIENAYTDLQIKRHQYEQMQEAQRSADRAEYQSDEQSHAQNYQAMESERRARAEQVRANGGRWIALQGNCWIDGDGNIVRSSDLR